MTTKSDTVVIIHETIWKSYASDAGTFVMLASLIGLGWLIDSSAMQWLGAIMGFISICVRSGHKMATSRMTIPQARAKLDELEGVA